MFPTEMDLARRSIRALKLGIVTGLLLIGEGPISAHALPRGELVIKTGTERCITPGSGAGCMPGFPMEEPLSIVVSPDAKHVYVGYKHGIARFNRDLNSGTLAASTECYAASPAGSCTEVDWLQNTRALAMDGDGKNLYVLAGNGIFRFDRNQLTGQLLFIQSNCIGRGGMMCSPTVPTMTQPTEISISPDGTVVFVIDSPNSYPYTSTIHSFHRDTSSGELHVGLPCYQKAPKSEVMCHEMRLAGNPKALRVSPDNATVYVVAENSLAVLDKNASSNILTQKAGTQGCFRSLFSTLEECEPARLLGGALDLAISPDGRSLYVLKGNHYDAGIAVFDRSPQTGLIQQKTGTLGCISDSGLGDTEEAPCADGRGLMYLRRLVMSVEGRNLYSPGGMGGGSVASLVRESSAGVAFGALNQTNDQSACYAAYGSGDCTQEDLLSDQLNTSMAMSPDGANVYVANRDYNQTDGTGGMKGVILVFDRPQEATPTPTHTPTPTTTPTFTPTPIAITMPTATHTPTPSAGDGIFVATPRFIVRPALTTKNRTALFAFHSATAGSSYWCSLDNSPFRACRWPVRYLALRPGQHTFEVKAVRRGSSSLTLSYTWTIRK